MGLAESCRAGVLFFERKVKDSTGLLGIWERDGNGNGNGNGNGARMIDYY